MSEHEHDHDHDHDHHGHDHDHHDHDHEPDEEAQLEAEREVLRRRALAQIRQYPDVALRMPAREVTEFDEYLLQLVERMQHLMHDAQGIGLAATQVGVLQRVFLIDAGGEEGLQALVNPTLVASGETETEEEGCLSLPEVRVPVERPLKVTIDAKDPTGGDVHLELEGLSARAAQHELDHLDGVLILDRTDPESRKEALGKLRPQPVLR
jgi:peptide deformylase